MTAAAPEVQARTVSTWRKRPGHRSTVADAHPALGGIVLPLGNITDKIHLLPNRTQGPLFIVASRV